MSFDEAVSSAMVSDALDAIGLRDCALSPNLMSLSAPGGVVGRAATVQFAPAGDVDPEEPYDAMIDFIDGLQEGDVAVVATTGNAASACWGELFSAAAKGGGAVGVITDGYARDLDRIRAVSFPVFAAGTRPVDFKGRMRVIERGGRVLIGGVVARPGDTVVADADGAVVVPAEALVDVQRIANERAGRESTVLAELLAGSDLREVWVRHGIL
jgi:4-hydroxy-4-methyl-2-oxoglutarate aldolase